MSLSVAEFTSGLRRPRKLGRILVALLVLAASTIAVTVAQPSVSGASDYTQILSGTLKDQSGRPILCTKFCKITASAGAESASTEIRDGIFSFAVPDGTLDIWLGDSQQFMRDDGGSKVNRVNSFSAGTWSPDQGPLDLKMPDIETAQFFHVTNAAGEVAAGVFTGYDQPYFTSTSFELRAATASSAAVSTTIQFYGMKQTDSRGDAVVFMYPTAETSRTSVGVDYSGAGLNVSLTNTPTQGTRAIALVAPGGNYVDQENTPPLFSLSLSRSSNSAPIGLDTSFSSSQSVYYATVNAASESIVVDAVAISESVNITILNADNLTAGEHIVTILVEESGAVRSYVVVVQLVAPTPQAPLSVSSLEARFGTPLTLGTSGGSGEGAVSFEVVDGTASGCAIAGGKLRSSTTGTCSVRAMKAADAVYASAESSWTDVAIDPRPEFTGPYTFSDNGDGTVTLTGIAVGGAANGKFAIVPADDGAGHPVTAIGFKGLQRHQTNSKLIGVSLPSTLTSIGSEAFAWNEDMTEINIPASVTSFGAWAFSGAAQNASEFSVYFEGSRPAMDSTLFPSNAQSGHLVYYSGEQDWPGAAVNGYTPELGSPRTQAPVVVTSTGAKTGAGLSLTSSGGSGAGAVSYQLVRNGTASDCAVENGVLTATSVGTCVVTATKAAVAAYTLATSAETDVTFALALDQSPLSVSSTTGMIMRPLTLTISGGSGSGAVSFEVVDGTASGCSITFGKLTVSGAGICSVRATKAADAVYASAESSWTDVAIDPRPDFTGPYTFSDNGDGTVTLTGIAVGGAANGKFAIVPADDGAGHPVTAIGTEGLQRWQTNSKLIGVSLPSTVTSIGMGAFAWNEDMTEINIPASVTSFGDYAFAGAAQNASEFSVYFEGSRPEMNSNLFPANAQSGHLVYYSGEQDWPGAAVNGYTPELGSPRTQAPVAITSVSGSAVSPLTLTSAGGSGAGAVSYQLVRNGTASGCAVENGVLTATSLGTCVVTATKAAVAAYTLATSAETDVTFTPISQAPLTVTSTVGTAGGSLTLQVSGGSGTGLVTYRVMEGTASSCFETTGFLTVSGAGTCAVTATKAASGIFAEVSSNITMVTFDPVQQSPLTLTSTGGTVGTPVVLMHSGGSGTGGISFQVTDGTAGTCSYVMAMVSVSAAGTCVVTVTKAASGIYAEVSSSPTTITFVDPPAPSTTTTTQAPTTTTTEVPPTSTTVVITEEDVLALPVTEFAPDLTTIAPGQPVRLTVGGFVPGELVDLYVASTPTYLGSGIADENGFVTIEGVIPDDLEGGSHSLVLLAPVSGIGFRQEVTLETTENVGGLPTTGSEAAPLVAFGVLIALLGAGLTIVARRRRVI